MKTQTLKWTFFVLSLCFILMNNSLYSQKEEQQTLPLKEGMARIIFTRHGSMMGAAVVHIVVDRGDSLKFNAYVIQKASFPAEKSNFDKAANVKSVYVKLNQKEAKLILGKPQKADAPVNHPLDLKSYPDLAEIQGPFKTFFGSDPVNMINSESLKPNARIVGAVGSGGTFTWDRTGGIMKIEDITPGGDQAFGPSFKVEPGKTYTVDYYYMKAKFDIVEKK
jgi:hypothetical protein